MAKSVTETLTKLWEGQLEQFQFKVDKLRVAILGDKFPQHSGPTVNRAVLVKFLTNSQYQLQLEPPFGGSE